MCNKYNRANNILECIKEIGQMREYPWIRGITILIHRSKLCDNSDNKTFRITIDDDRLQEVVLSVLDAHAYRQEKRFELLGNEESNNKPVHRP